MATQFKDFETMIEHFYHWESTTPDNTFLRQPEGNSWKTLTFAEAGQEARKMSTALDGLGLQKGDHVAIFSKNCYHWIIADLAIMMSGLVSVPLYATLPKEKLAEVLDKSDAKAVFLGKLDDWGNRAEAIKPDCIAIKFPQYDGNAKVTIGEDWDTLVKNNAAKTENFVPDKDSLWTILFTSGTTGTPKGVMHPHRTPAMIMSDERKANWIGSFKCIDHRYFSFLPLNHVAERLGMETPALATGGSISFAQNLDTFANNLRDTQPTTLFAVPRIWVKFYQGVIAQMPQKKLDTLLKIPIVSGMVKKKLLTALGLNKVQIVATGAAITPAYLKDWYKNLGIHMIEAYGMTEVCGSMTNGPMKDCPQDSVGKAIPQGEVKIHADTDEILMKTPYMMTGYYKDPELTAEVLVDGWMHSGDRGTIDDQGYVRVIGRVKDAFKTSKGSFVTPNPMEEILSSNEYIEQVCVVGLGIPQPMAMVNLSETGTAADKAAVEKSILETVSKLNAKQENYSKVTTVIIDSAQWSEDNEMLTPTLKIRRTKIDDNYGKDYLAWHDDASKVVWK